MGMDLVEKEGGLPVFDTGNIKFVFLTVAEIITWLIGKIGVNLPIAEVLTQITFMHTEGE